MLCINQKLEKSDVFVAGDTRTTMSFNACHALDPYLLDINHISTTGKRNTFSIINNANEFLFLVRCALLLQRKKFMCTWI